MLCRYDANKHMTSLETEWVSVANALQRAGRAGRVRPGVSFHLYTNHRFQHQLRSKPPPEIELISLERSIMRCKSLPVFSGQTPEIILGYFLFLFCSNLTTCRATSPFFCSLRAIPCKTDDQLNEKELFIFRMVIQ